MDVYWSRAAAHAVLAVGVLAALPLLSGSAASGASCPPLIAASVRPAALTAGQGVELPADGPAEPAWDPAPLGYRRVTVDTTEPINSWTSGHDSTADGSRSVTWTFAPTTNS